MQEMTMAFCGKCGSQVSDGHSFCLSCGNPVTSPSSSITGAAVGAAPALEKVFYQDPEVVVTNSRCIVSGQTYAMSGITSVQSFTEIPSKKRPILLIILGAIVSLGSLRYLTVVALGETLIAFLFGCLVIGAGIMWFKRKKNIYHVQLVASSTQSRIIHNGDATYILKIVAALNDAIVYRH
jgi:hypothetical protein